MIAVTAILIISSLWASAMMGAMLPTYERIVSMKVESLARNAAEAGLDYVVGQLNAALASPGTTSPLDATVLDSHTTTTLPDNLTGSTGAQVSVTVYNELPPTTAITYDRNIAQMVTSQTNPLANPFRRVEATATIAGFRKRIRVLLTPAVSSPPIFPCGAFAATALNAVGPASTDSYNLADNDPYKIPMYVNGQGNYNIHADLGSNSGIKENGDTTHPINLGGSVYQFPPPNSNQSVQDSLRQNIISQFDSTPSKQAPWLKIYDNVYSNTDSSGYWPRGQYPNRMSTFNNVYGWSTPGTVDPANPSQPGPFGQVSPYGTYSHVTVQPAPASPAGTFNLGNVRLSGTAKIIFQDNASVPSGALANLSSGTVTLPTGNYVMGSLTMTGTSSIVVQGSNPVNVYIEGVSSGSTAAVALGSNTAVNMHPNAHASNLKIYYNGTKTISMAGQSSAVIYAPNSSIMVGLGNGNPADFYGAMVGDVVDMNGGLNSSGAAAIHFDASLRQGDVVTLNGLGYFNQMQVVGLKVVSWQEL